MTILRQATVVHLVAMAAAMGAHAQDATTPAANEPKSAWEVLSQRTDVLVKVGEGIEKAGQQAADMKAAGLLKSMRELQIPVRGSEWSYRKFSEAASSLDAATGPLPKGGSLPGRMLSLPGGLKSVTGIDKVMDGWEIVKPVVKEGWRGVPEVPTAAADVVANNAAAEWGAVHCARIGFCVGARLGPKGAIVGGIVGGIGGAVGSSYVYQYHVKPALKDMVRGQGKPQGRIVALNVNGPAETEPGADIEFRAMAEMDLTYVQVDPGAGQESGAKVVTRRISGVNASPSLIWSAAGGQSTGYGRVRIPCSAAGTSIVVTASDPVTGVQGSAAVRVEKLLLSELLVEATESRVKPGAAVPLRVQAFEGRHTCTREAKLAQGDLAWKVSRGGTVEGAVLRIDREAGSGPVTVSVRGPNNIVSPTLTVEVVAEPVLERIAIAVPGQVKPCDIVAPTATGFYSDDPKTPRAVRGLRWSFAGRYTPRGEGRARAEWPETLLKVTASAPTGKGEVSQTADVRVGPLDFKVPWFPIQSYTVANRIRVGDGFVAKAIEFSCDEGARPAHNVRWSSSAPGVLACSPNGECSGVAPGAAVVNLDYEGRTVISEPVRVEALPEQPTTKTADATPATTVVPPSRTCMHWSDCPAGQVCENGQCVAKPDISVSCSPQVVKVGQPVSVSVGATYADRGHVDVTGTAKLSRSNPFVPTDAGTYIVSANYQGVIGRCAVKVEGDKPSPCPGDQVRASDGSCVPVSSVDAVVGTYGQRQGERDRDRSGVILPGAGLGSIDWSARGMQGPGTGRPFGPDTLKDALERGRTIGESGAAGERRDGGHAGGATTVTPARPGGSGTGVTPPAQGGDKSGGTTPPPATPVQSGWYLFEWVVKWSKADCAEMLHVNYNRAYLTSAEVEEYRAYVLRSFPSVMPSGAAYKSGTVRMLSGPSSTPPTVPAQKNECIVDSRVVPQPQIFGR